jgi:phospholipid/cholesterol/gamma-HCH transport system substrate-binding protein
MARSSKPKWVRLAGLLSIIAFGTFAYVAVTSGTKVKKGEKYIYLYVNDALGLVKNSAVMIAGVEVGRVTDLSVAHDKAKITIAVDPEEKIPKRVRGIVRARSLLGEKFLELQPIDKEPNGEFMEGNETIGAEDTTKTLELDQFATDFDPLIDRVSRFLDAINPADPEKPNLIENLAKASGSLSRGLEGKEEEVGALVDNLDRATGRIDGIIARNSERGGRVFENLDAVLLDGKRSQIVPQLSEAAEGLSSVAEEIQKGKTIGKLDKVLVRLDPILTQAEKIDESALRKFLQVEGIKGHVRMW